MRTERATGFALFPSELAVLPDDTDTLPDQHWSVTDAPTHGTWEGEPDR